MMDFYIILFNWQSGNFSSTELNLKVAKSFLYLSTEIMTKLSNVSPLFLTLIAVALIVVCTNLISFGSTSTFSINFVS